MSISGEDSRQFNFKQTFSLAPEKGRTDRHTFFVRKDILQFMEDVPPEVEVKVHLTYLWRVALL